MAAPCSSTAAAIVEATSDSFAMVVEMPLIAENDHCVAARIPEIRSLIAQVAWDVCSARALI